MNLKITSFLVLLFLCFYSCQNDEIPSLQYETAETVSSLLSRDDLNSRIGEIIQTQNAIAWNDLSDLEIASAFYMSDSKIATVGWSMNSADDYEKDVILEIFQELEPKSGDDKQVQIVEVNTEANYLDLKIDNVETLITLRNLPEVIITDVYYNVLSENQQKEAARRIKEAQLDMQQGDAQRVSTGTSSDPVVAANHDFHAAWNDPQLSQSAGNGIKVAIIDTGIPQDDPIYGQGQNNVVSNSRKLGFYKKCEWCWWQSFDGPYSTPDLLFTTHGVSRMREIGNPLNPSNSDPEPLGVAYNATMTSIRAAEYVAFDLLGKPYNNVKGIQRAYEHVADSNIDIVSMSMGSLFDYYKIEQAVIDCTTNGKLVFNAAGTLPVGIILELVFFQSAGEFTVFPARMEQTVACTATNYIGNQPFYSISAFGRADFISHHNFPNGTSSEATAYTVGMAAMIWGDNIGLSAQGVYNKMKLASDSPSGDLNSFGYGRVNMQKYLDNN